MLRPTPTCVEAKRDKNAGGNVSAPQGDVNGETAGRDLDSEAAAAERSSDKVVYGKCIRERFANRLGMFQVCKSLSQRPLSRELSRVKRRWADPTWVVVA